ncbi:Cystinosin-like protein isoform X3 [Oopsacas minuta]|uniref:Cystinosin-like protein isoform X3 n=1 Tax=Oopsacas minuta TaxID=111878 RepID=A0AAV7JGG4_9METZ|nr:Cystinosin-like protein isoform X3 [Oopsacas minuta]
MSSNTIFYRYSSQLVVGEISNLTFIANLTSSLILTFFSLEERHPRIVSLPPNTSFQTGNSVVDVYFGGLSPGKAVYQLSPNYPVQFPNGEYIRFSVLHYSFLQWVSNSIGWMYFLCWSISFYPQVVQNFLRKSIDGFSVDYVLMNILGYFSYSTFNVSLYWSTFIQDQYLALHPGGVNPVRLNDVIFSLHGLAISLVILLQTIYYGRKLHVSPIACTILIFLLLAAGITCILAVVSVTSWLNCIYVMSYVKLVITVIKYTPQAWMNYRSKSTVGFSIEGIWLDFSGGVLSVLQMVILAYNFNDWLSIFGDFVKFWLGVISIGFDIIFVLQHYVLYRDKVKGFRCFGIRIFNRNDKQESQSLLRSESTEGTNQVKIN